MESVIKSKAKISVESPEIQTTKWTEMLVKKLANTWRGSFLTMESNAQDMTASTILPSLKNEISVEVSPLMNGIDEDQISSVLRRSEEIISAFLQSKYVITNIDRRGLIDLVCLAVQSCTGNFSFEDLELRIGFGATPTTMPNARLPSYILAAKSILNALRRDEGAKGIPRVLLYSAAQFVGSVNGGSSDEVMAAARQNFELIKAYLERFEDPEVTSRFQFDEDREVSPEEQISALIDFYAIEISNTCLWDEDVSEAKQKVYEMGKKYGSTLNDSLRYSAAHVIYAGDPVQGVVEGILSESDPRPANLIMIGGEPERIFWRIREAIKRNVTIEKGYWYFKNILSGERLNIDRTPASNPSCCTEAEMKLFARFRMCSNLNANEGGDEYRRSQLISKAGQMPVYGMYKGDWSIRDVAERSYNDLLAAPFDLRMKRDLLAVLCDIADLSPEVAYTFKNNKPLDPEVSDRLKSAYEQYADFCRNFLSQTNYED